MQIVSRRFEQQSAVAVRTLAVLHRDHRMVLEKLRNGVMDHSFSVVLGRCAHQPIGK
jgi:hypothetical protein